MNLLASIRVDGMPVQSTGYHTYTSIYLDVSVNVIFLIFAVRHFLWYLQHNKLLG